MFVLINGTNQVELMSGKDYFRFRQFCSRITSDFHDEIDEYRRSNHRITPHERILLNLCREACILDNRLDYIHLYSDGVHPYNEREIRDIESRYAQIQKYQDYRLEY